MTALVTPTTTISFLGPRGTFTEEALRRDPELAVASHKAMGTFVEVLSAVGTGSSDLAFVALENSIEGTVPVTVDQLIFERELIILREVVLPITQNLLTRPGTTLADVRRVVSFPHATAQCRRWLGANVPAAVEMAATSTAEAVRLVAEGTDGTGAGTAAIGTALAAELYGLDVLASHIEDHPDNVTRFVLVGPADSTIPAPTGHDKTSVVCFQSADRPGSLHGILGQFTARDINLVKLESRPTKHRLGDYCFIIDFEGHVADEVVADCLRDLHATLRELKFLGSYPAAGDGAHAIRATAGEAWRAADSWMRELQGRVDTQQGR
ncbi:prephenate dehydratase [Acidiferrimicrobium sp. IK]|uniref:prephenate dehydratase n=1 Tax=Acidiferrimicrobium sp. IK TaxID=2871700 RepID=UPI0021CB050B|nr:prephenate dehydratase [Acidiferrimicrobium sp. IK]MCU4185982.1 prephenate dehydratase [Acidiferrimicrobium sp. IK]